MLYDFLRFYVVGCEKIYRNSRKTFFIARLDFFYDDDGNK